MADNDDRHPMGVGRCGNSSLFPVLTTLGSGPIHMRDIPDDCDLLNRIGKIMPYEP